MHIPSYESPSSGKPRAKMLTSPMKLFGSVRPSLDAMSRKKFCAILLTAWLTRDQIHLVIGSSRSLSSYNEVKRVQWEYYVSTQQYAAKGREDDRGW